MKISRYEATTLFVATLREHGTCFAYQPRSFALAVDDLPNNEVAKVFTTYNGAAGRDSQDFREALTIAQSACLLYFVSPSFNEFEIQFGPRLIKQFLQGPHVSAARKLALGYITQLKSTNR